VSSVIVTQLLRGRSCPSRRLCYGALPSLLGESEIMDFCDSVFCWTVSAHVHRITLLASLRFQNVLCAKCPENWCWWTWSAPFLGRRIDGNAVRAM
jgi:hypothetical protein